MADSYHRPVLLDQVLDALDLKQGGIYVDATCGGGSHSRAIADLIGTDGTVVGIDRDPEALVEAATTLAGAVATFISVNVPFDFIGEALDDLGIEAIDGVLYDLGVSSHQLDDSSRGFTFRDPTAPLDMRMSQLEDTPTAADLLNSLSEGELSRIFRENADEAWSARIAKFVVERRDDSPYETASQLVETVRAAIPAAARSKEIHPATKVFQALRIAVNDEFGRLERSLSVAVRYLKSGGRLVTIDYHSGEARIIKALVAELSGRCICPPEMPQCNCRAKDPVVKLVVKKPIVPSPLEIANNPRARSAKLRIAAKL